MSENGLFPVDDGRVVDAAVVPDSHGAGLPVGAKLQVVRVVDQIVEKLQDAVRLGLLELHDAARERAVNEERAATQHWVHAHERVDVGNGLAALNAALIRGVLGLLFGAVDHVQRAEELLERGRQALERGDGVAEERVAAAGGALKHAEEGVGGWLELVRDVRVPADRGDAVVEHTVELLDVRATEGDVQLVVAAGRARGLVHVETPEVTPVLDREPRPVLREVLLAEQNDAALRNEQREFVLARRAQLADLHALDLSSELGRNLAHARRVLRARPAQQMGQLWVRAERGVVVLVEPQCGQLLLGVPLGQELREPGLRAVLGV